MGRTSAIFTFTLTPAGLTSEQAKAYQQQISQGSVLLIVEGSGQEVDRAKYLLAQFIG